MEYFVKRYYERMGEVTEWLGFRKHKRSVVRVVNDVLQGFHIDILNRSKQEAECQIDFGIRSLFNKPLVPDCWGWPVLYGLGQPLGNFNIQYMRYIRTSEESVNACVEAIAEDVQERLLPMFERVTDTKFALAELCDMEKKMNETHEVYHELDLCFPGDDNKYYMALKHNNYEYILHSYKIAIRMAEIYYKQLEGVQNIFAVETAEKTRNTIAHYQHLIDTFDERDDTELKKTLAENEAQALEELKRFVVKI
jgi:hypothetical protein